MQVYVPIWTLTSGLNVDSKSIGVFSDPKSAFLALLKKGVDEGYICREIYVMNNTTPVSFYDALDSLGGPPQQIDDVNKEMERMQRANKEPVMKHIQSFDTTDKFSSFLYGKYIADADEDLEEMNIALESLVDYCAIKYFVENFRGSVCVHYFQ